MRMIAKHVSLIWIEDSVWIGFEKDDREIIRESFPKRGSFESNVSKCTSLV
jgi:hypothetical protein